MDTTQPIVEKKSRGRPKKYTSEEEKKEARRRVNATYNDTHREQRSVHAKQFYQEHRDEIIEKSQNYYYATKAVVSN